MKAQRQQQKIDRKKKAAHHRVYADAGLLEWRKKLKEFLDTTQIIHAQIRLCSQKIIPIADKAYGYIERLQKLENKSVTSTDILFPDTSTPEGRPSLIIVAKTDYPNIMTIPIVLNCLKKNTEKLEANFETLNNLLKKIALGEAGIEANYRMLQLQDPFFSDEDYEAYKVKALRIISVYQQNNQTISKDINAAKAAIKQYSDQGQECKEMGEEKKKEKLLSDKKHDAEREAARLLEIERQNNIAKIKQRLMHFFQDFKEKNALTSSCVEISLANLITESSAKKPEQLLTFNKVRIPTLLVPAVKNVEKQRVEFYETLLTILSSDTLTTLEKYKRALALKNNTIYNIVDTLSSYGTDFLDPDGEWCLKEIYLGTMYEYEKMILNIAQCVHCENMRRKQVLSEKLDVLQEQPNYSTLNEKQYLAQFNTYARSFKLSKDLAFVEDDCLKLQEIGNCIKTAKILLMPSNTDSDNSDVESKEIKEAADVNFEELPLTDNAFQYLDQSALLFLDRLYSSQQNVTFRELFTFCDMLRADQTDTSIENHTVCRLPNIWASESITPTLLTLAIGHSRNAADNLIQDPNVLSQIRGAFRGCGITVDLIQSAQERYPESPLRMWC